jgi:hypothetical protein
MSDCKHDCVILKRICVFILGVLIGFAGGYKYGITEAKQKHHDKFIKKAEKPMLLEKRERRKKLREHMQRTETPKVRVPR